MSTDPSAHIDPETIAAMSDGRLPAQDAARVRAHLATCDACYETFADTVYLTSLDDAAPVTNVPAPGERRRHRWLPVFAAAAAVILAVVWFRPFGIAFTSEQRSERAVTRLAAVLGAGRPSIGRLADPFPYGEAPSATRSGAPSSLPPAIEEAVVQIRLLVQEHRDATSLGALGLAELVAGRMTESLAAFEESVRLDDRNPEVRAHYAAAWLEQWRLTGRAADAEQALNHAHLAVLAAPDSLPALFNRAYALEALGMIEDAAAAWTAVRDREPGSPWAREADIHLASIRKRVANQADRPATTLRLVWRELLRWADTPPGPDRRFPAEAAAAALELRTLGRDAFLPDVAAAVNRVSSPGEIACLSGLIRMMHDSRTRFDESDYAGATKAAEQAHSASACAGVGREAIGVQRAWATFFEGKRDAGLELARVHHQAAIDRDYWRAAAVSEYMIGLDAQARARISESLDAFRRALTWANLADDPDITATILTGAAETLTSSGDFGEALTFHQQALEEWPALSPRRRHLVLAGCVLTSLANRHAGSALHFAEQLVANASVWAQPSGVVSAHLRHAQALTAAGLPSEAMVALDLASRSNAGVQSPREQLRYRAEIALFRGQLLQERDPQQSIADLTEAQSIFGEIPAPLRTPEVMLARSRAHIAAGQFAAARDDLRAGIEVFESQSPEIRDEQLRVTRASAMWDLFGTLIVLEQHDAAKSLAVAERARARALLDALARTDRLRPLDGPALYDWLPPHVTVVAYAALPDVLLRWRVTSTGASVESIPLGAAQLEATVTQFVEALQLRKPVDAAGRLLATSLIPTATARDGTKRLVFLPDGPLFRLPFGSLPLGDDRGVLDDDFVTSVAPSLSMLKETATRGSAPGPALLVGYGATREAGRFPALPLVAQELNHVAEAYPHHARLEGAAATGGAVLAAMPRATVIHFAGHAVANEMHPSESRLLVAPSGDRGELRTEEIAGVRLQTGTVVVLSACDTARGRIYRGEGAMTLARPFLAAGASAVVATLWRVRDDALFGVLAQFHRELASGLDAPQAMARARQSAAIVHHPDERSLVVIGMGGVR